MTEGKYSEAIAYYDIALTINPHQVNALTGKGLALDELGNYTGAIGYFDKALAIQPNNIYPLDNKGITLDVLGEEQVQK